MNRRAFLRGLSVAPVVVPLAIVGTAHAATPEHSCFIDKLAEIVARDREGFVRRIKEAARWRSIGEKGIDYSLITKVYAEPVEKL